MSDSVGKGHNESNNERVGDVEREDAVGCEMNGSEVLEMK